MARQCGGISPCKYPPSATWRAPQTYFLLGWAGYGLVALLCFLLGSWFANRMATRAPPSNTFTTALSAENRLDLVVCAHRTRSGTTPHQHWRRTVRTERVYLLHERLRTRLVLGVLFDVNAGADPPPTAAPHPVADRATR